MTKQEFDNYKFGINTKIIFSNYIRKEDEDFLAVVDFGDRTVFTRRTCETVGYRRIKKVFEDK